MKISEVTSSDITTDDKKTRLEMNRAAAMRSRTKKRLEMTRLKSLVVEINNEKLMLEAKVSQYEMFIQVSMAESTMLRMEIGQLMADNALLKQNLGF